MCVVNAELETLSLKEMEGGIFILADAEGAFVSVFVDSGAWDQRC